MISKSVKIVAMAGMALLALAGQAGAASQQLITVTRNGVQRLPLSAAAGSVIVANPEIADVNVVDSHTVYVIGRGYGASAVTILDRAGHPIFDGRVMVTAGQQNAVTMYKGSTPTVMLCSNVCQPAQGAVVASPDAGASGSARTAGSAEAPGVGGLSAVAAATTPGQ